MQLANGDGVQFCADDLAVTDAGTLVAASLSEGQTVVMFTAGPGKWNHAYATSMVDGRPVAVESKGGAKKKLIGPGEKP